MMDERVKCKHGQGSLMEESKPRRRRRRYGPYARIELEVLNDPNGSEDE